MSKAKLVAVFGSVCLLSSATTMAYAESYEQSDTQSSNAYIAEASPEFYRPTPVTTYRVPAAPKADATSGAADPTVSSTSYLMGHEREY